MAISLSITVILGIIAGLMIFYGRVGKLAGFTLLSAGVFLGGTFMGELDRKIVTGTVQVVQTGVTAVSHAGDGATAPKKVHP